MKNIVYILLFLHFLSYGDSIEKVKIFLHTDSPEFAVPVRYKSYLTSTQIKEFEAGRKRIEKDWAKIYYITYYVWESEKLIKISEGYFYLDGAFGAEKIYHPNGKLSEEREYILVNDSTGKTISMEEFNKIATEENNGAGYLPKPHGYWKYYNQRGGVIKEEKYDKGKLLEVKEINSQ